MIELQSEELKKAVLIGADTDEYDVEYSMEELKDLAESCDIKVMFTVVQNRDRIDSATYIGSGKLDEIKSMVEEYNIDIAICDTELTGSQFRNIEKILDIPIIDRTTVILDIFARRAVSREGAIQVELAQQKYRLPRLSGMGASLSRLGGGIGTRGPGESKLESDRRHIMRRIHSLEEELEIIKDQRERTTQRRKKNNVPIIALAGYTNSGKSTLLNKITGSDVLSKDQLFATLDPTARKFLLPDGTQAVMIDTVGFLQRIPHHLIEAFKSTLLHLKQADCILMILDGSDENCLMHKQVTQEMLDSLGCDDIPVIVVFNKADKSDDLSCENSQCISALTGDGVDSLLDAICERLELFTSHVDFLVPYKSGKITAEIHREAINFEEEYIDDGILIHALVRKSTLKNYNEFIVK